MLTIRINNSQEADNPSSSERNNFTHTYTYTRGHMDMCTHSYMYVYVCVCVHPNSYLPKDSPFSLGIKTAFPQNHHVRHSMHISFE